MEMLLFVGTPLSLQQTKKALLCTVLSRHSYKTNTDVMFTVYFFHNLYVLTELRLII